MNALTAWLRVPGILDPVDRRNAPALQVALLALGTMPPLLWLYRAVGTDIPWRPGEAFSLFVSLLISALALWSVVLIRRSLFQRAIRQLMAIVAVLTVVSHGANGLSAHIFEMPIQLLWLFIAGMMIGRRALWAMFLALAVALFLGAFAEARTEQTGVGDYLGDALIRSIMFVMIALVIDRSVAALRESLDEALSRGRQLEQSNVKLHAEMRAREQAQAHLLHAQKMEAAGRMASGLAHDFRHLLGLISGYAGQAQRAIVPEEQTVALDGIRSATRRAQAHVGKLMHFCRADVPLIETIDAREALEEVEPMLRQTLGASIRLRLQAPETSVFIQIDREQFALVLLNLAANAVDAMVDCGEFAITGTVDKGKKMLRIHVHDDGPGISEAVRTRIFEPFFTTKPEGRGTGLGLAVSRDLARSWGGELAYAGYRDPVGTGACFYLDLPLVLSTTPAVGSTDVDMMMATSPAGNPLP